MKAGSLRWIWKTFSMCLSLALGACNAVEMIHAAEPALGPKTLVARAYDSGFEMSHDTWNGMGVASNGKVYYVLCSESADVGAQMFCYDPATGRIRHVGDLTEACGEKGLKAIPQGKSHVTFVEHDGKLYFATHLAYYNPDDAKDAKEKKATPPPGYKPYPGGHFLAYDMARGTFRRLASAPHGEGILTMNMDVQRGRLYGLTWPTGYFLRYDLAKQEMKQFGPIAGQGEAGQGPTYSTLCRAIVIDPGDGSAYLTTSAGDILRYRCDRDSLETVAEENLRKDYFGVYDPTKPGHMGYNWRQAVWHPAEKVIYGVHGNSGYLFRFDPHVPRVEVLERITSEPSRRSGMNDKFRYGYLGFTLRPDQRTLYYLTGGPFPAGQKPPALKGQAKQPEENLHLVTYDIPTARCLDHGAIFFADGQRPSRVHSIAVSKDGAVYCLSRINRNGRFVPDLISIPPTAGGEGPQPADFRTQFLQLCDTACQELDAGTRTDAFFRDSYAVRALAAAYDMTGKRAYFNTCRRWSDRMIAYQNDMIPKGAYYMHYGRKPGEDKGEWFVGDSSSIALGLLATAVRSPDPKERQRYLDSVKLYAKLVIDNYVGPEGGITDGLWFKFDGQWWCSTGIFGSLAFLLYNETGDETYRKVALGTVDWLNRLDFNNVGGPISFEERPPTVVMYILETYSVALPQLEPGSQRHQGAMVQFNKCLQWMAKNQRGRVPTLPWDYNSHKKGAKFGGLPFHMYVNAKYVPDSDGLRTAADQELRYIASVLWKDGPPKISQLAAFAMMSYAEKLSPGAVYGSGKR